MIPLSARLEKQTLTLSFFLIIIIFLSFGVITKVGLHALTMLTQKIYEHPLVVSNASLQAALNIAKMHRDMKDIVLADQADQVAVTLQEISSNEQQVYQQLDLVRDHILGESGMALERDARLLFDSWKPIRREVVELFKAGRQQEAILITQQKGAQHVAQLEAKMQELSTYARNKADSFFAHAQNKQAELEQITMLMTLLGVSIAVIIAVIAIRLTLKGEALLTAKTQKLQKALDDIKTLQGILPICMHCKQIRDDKGSWNQLEKYISEHSEAQFSHGICEKCLKEHYPDVEPNPE